MNEIHPTLNLFNLFNISHAVGRFTHWQLMSSSHITTTLICAELHENKLFFSIRLQVILPQVPCATAPFQPAHRTFTGTGQPQHFFIWTALWQAAYPSESGFQYFGWSFTRSSLPIRRMERYFIFMGDCDKNYSFKQENEEGSLPDFRGNAQGKTSSVKAAYYDST